MPEPRSLSRIEERLPEVDDTGMVIQASNIRQSHRSWAYPWRFTYLKLLLGGVEWDHATHFHLPPGPSFFPFIASMSNVLLIEPSHHRLTVAITSIESKYGVHGDDSTSYLPLLSTSVFLMFQPYAYEETKEAHREHLRHVNAIRHWKRRPSRSYRDVQIFIYAFLHITKPIQDLLQTMNNNRSTSLPHRF